MFKVDVKPKIQKKVDDLPAPERKRFTILLESLRDRGPVQGSFPNYSKLGGNKHHCHLSPRWVACWEETKKRVQIEVYYVGSRRNAPY